MTVVDRAPRPRAGRARRGRQDRRGRRRRHAHRPVARRAPRWRSTLGEAQAVQALDADLERIVDAARETVRAGRPAARRRSTRCTSPAARPACACWRSASPRRSRRRARCAATASPAWPPASGCIAQRWFTRAAADPLAAARRGAAWAQRGLHGPADVGQQQRGAHQVLDRLGQVGGRLQRLDLFEQLVGVFQVVGRRGAGTAARAVR